MTRGSFGFRYQNKDKLGYSNSDSYPSSLGHDMLLAIKEYSKEEMITLFNKMESAPDDEALWDLGDWFKHSRTDDEVPYYRDNDFIYDSLYCEYAYIINLDNDTLEYYVGFQKERDTNPDNRYKDHTPKDDYKYYSCKLVKVFPFDYIKSKHMDEVVDEMRALKG